ncbi:uncharacterized protein [Haliotis cracherodii]|uniref:uncharacterized protein n=1 Tax=Haliotis cracherodii TaxID=6455 RepID=UPI0039EB25DC
MSFLYCRGSQAARIRMNVTFVFVVACLVALTLATPRDARKNARKQDRQSQESEGGQQKRDTLTLLDTDTTYGSSSVTGYEDHGYYNQYDYGYGWLEYYNKDEEQQEASQETQQRRRRRRRAVPVVRRVQ